MRAKPYCSILYDRLFSFPTLVVSRRAYHPYEGNVTGPRSQAQQDVHFCVMRLSQDNTEMSQRSLTRAIGVGAGGIHPVLNALPKKGLFKLGRPAAIPDKRRYTYILTPLGLAAKATLMRQLVVSKMAEY